LRALEKIRPLHEFSCSGLFLLIVRNPLNFCPIRRLAATDEPDIVRPLVSRTVLSHANRIHRLPPGTHFGRETTVPHFTSVDLTPLARVPVGTPVVKGFGKPSFEKTPEFRP